MQIQDFDSNSLHSQLPSIKTSTVFNRLKSNHNKITINLCVTSLFNTDIRTKILDETKVRELVKVNQKV